MTKLLLLIIVYLMSYLQFSSAYHWLNDTEYIAHSAKGSCIMAALSPCPGDQAYSCAKTVFDNAKWKKADSPGVKKSAQGNTRHQKCLSEKECMDQVALKYSISFGRVDCNCDGYFDFSDRVALITHSDRDCGVQGVITRDAAQRFNDCAEGKGLFTRIVQSRENCSPRIIP